MKCFYQVFLLIVCLSVTLFAKDDFQNMRVVWIEKPQTEAMIIWDSDKPAEDDYVKLELNGKEINKVYSHFDQAYTNIDKKRNKIEGDKFYVRHIKLRGLTPDSLYSFVAHSSDHKSKKYSFKTAPNNSKDVKIIFVGDSRTRIEVAEKISEQMRDLSKDDQSIIATLHGGDYANVPELKYWKPWLSAYSRTTQKNGRLLPIIPVCGNHESISRSPLYGEAYGYPGGKGKYTYSCELTPEVSIVILNSEISAMGDQRKFLDETLMSYKKDKIKWQLAAYHRPIYPAVKGPGAGLTAWAPLFEKYDLDISLESDGHNIKRTLPIRDNKHSPDGVVYLGEGGYGAPQRTPKDKWYLKEPGMATSGDHLMTLHFKEDTISYETIGIKGDVIDSYEFKARKR